MGRLIQQEYIFFIKKSYMTEQNDQSFSDEGYEYEDDVIIMPKTVTAKCFR